VLPEGHDQAAAPAAMLYFRRGAMIADFVVMPSHDGKF
jgi:hypothetical protein